MRFTLPGWNAKGYIAKKLLNKSLRATEFMGIGDNNTLFWLVLKPYGDFRYDDKGIGCVKDGRRCNGQDAQEADRNKMTQLHALRAEQSEAYFKAMLEVVAGMRLKGVPYTYVENQP